MVTTTAAYNPTTALRHVRVMGDPQSHTLTETGHMSLLTGIHDRSDRFRVTVYDFRDAAI